MSSSWVSPPPCRWAGWAGRTRWRKPPCSSRRTTAATSPASSCSSMAAWPRSRQLRAETKASYNGEGGIHELGQRVPRRPAVPAEIRTGSRRRRADSSWGKQGMQKQEPGRGDPSGPLDWRQILPFEAAAASDQLGWVGLEAARCCAEPAFELSVPALTHHRLVLVTRPPADLDLRYEGVKRHRPTPAGSITLVPAGSPGL